MKIARLKSPLSDVLRLSSPRPRLRHGRRLALLSRPNPTLNLCTFFFVMSLALLPYRPPLLILPTVSFPRCRLRSLLITRDPTFLFSSQRSCVAEPETTFMSSAELRVLRSLTSPSALSSPPLNFLRLFPTFPPPQPLPQLSIPC